MALNRVKVLALGVALSALAACGSPQADATNTASAPDAAAANTTQSGDAAALLASASTEAANATPVAGSAVAAPAAPDGARVFRQCASCHSIEAGRNMVGPSLHGVVGRAAGGVPGFTYSTAMKASGLTWDEATLDRYLENPRATVTGTNMSFAGLRKPEDRAAVIAYLKEQG